MGNRLRFSVVIDDGRPRSSRRADRPNVVLVLMDDMGYGDRGCMGGTVVRTPRMDAVAECIDFHLGRIRVPFVVP